MQERLLSPLMEAILAKDCGAAATLLGQGVDPNEHDLDQRWTALHIAARDNDAELVRLLLGHGAEVDPVDIYGDTPLWRATFEAAEQIEAILLLLRAGADPDRANHSGNSPRHIAHTLGRADLLAAFEQADIN